MAPPFPSLENKVKAVYPVPPEDLPDKGEDHRFETMAIWNRKGGVAKTTTCHALGFAYALKGRRVLMVDADPQCDLSCLLLQEWVRYQQTHEDTEKGIVDYNLFFNHQVPGRAMKNNLRTALEPVIQFAGSGGALGAWSPADVTKIELREGCTGALFLLPGHQDIYTYEKKVTISYGSNLNFEPAAPGAWNKLMALTARKCGADIVLVDCNPHVGSLNMHIVLTSNYLFLPCTPDFHSHNAIKALPHILKEWVTARDSARNTLVHSQQLPLDLQIPGGNPRILGASVMKFTQIHGRPAKSFVHWIDHIKDALHDGSVTIHDTPTLAGMAGTPGEPNTWPSILADVPDFASLGALSHYYGFPVFALGPGHMGNWDPERGAMQLYTGNLKKTMKDKVMIFQKLFKSFIQNVGSKVVSGPFLVDFSNNNSDDARNTDSNTGPQQVGQEIPESTNDPTGAFQDGRND